MIILCLTQMAIPYSFANNNNQSDYFRVPAKRVGKSFVIKLELKQGGGSYVVEAWLDPKSADSTLDPAPMRELGWRNEGTLAWSSVEASGHPLPLWRFKEGRNEVTYLPQYVHSCCEARLGADVLNHYYIRATELLEPTMVAGMTFDSAYVEFFKGDTEKEGTPSLKKKHFEIIEPKISWKTLKTPLFKIHFVPPSRKVVLESNFKKILRGSEWITVNGRKVSQLDLPVIEQYLTGKKAQKITLEFLVKNETQKIEYNFKMD